MSGDFRYSNVLASQKAAGVAFNTYTTAKSVINATEVVNLAGNSLGLGATLRIRACGALSNIVTTPGTVTFQVMVGSVVAWTSGAIQMSTTANTSLPYDLDVLLTLYSESVTGTANQATIFGVGKLTALGLTIGSGANPTVTNTTIVVPVTTPAVGTGFESNATMAIDFWVGFSSSAAGNGIKNGLYVVERLA
jgi:hypothetical protein